MVHAKVSESTLPHTALCVPMARMVGVYACLVRRGASVVRGLGRGIGGTVGIWGIRPPRACARPTVSPLLHGHAPVARLARGHGIARGVWWRSRRNRHPSRRRGRGTKDRILVKIHAAFVQMMRERLAARGGGGSAGIFGQEVDGDGRAAVWGHAVVGYAGQDAGAVDVLGQV